MYRVDALIKRHGGKVMRFDKLPIPAQAAVAFYMSVDGEAWSLAPTLQTIIDRYWTARKAASAWGYRDVRHVVSKVIRRALPYYRKRYGAYGIGYVEIPVDDLIRSVMQDWGVAHVFEHGFEDFVAYHRWYVRANVMPTHRASADLWPVILDRDPDNLATLQDGWHRFHRYVQLGIPIIPAVYYL